MTICSSLSSPRMSVSAAEASSIKLARSTKARHNRPANESKPDRIPHCTNFELPETTFTRRCDGCAGCINYSSAQQVASTRAYCDTTTASSLRFELRSTNQYSQRPWEELPKLYYTEIVKNLTEWIT
ncbi:hypothetical protein J1614_003065 [Plenodomus biglobosus]|nr:hypothetical protein J1614_003065 [Plenodomus biglobosus]